MSNREIFSLLKVLEEVKDSGKELDIEVSKIEFSVKSLKNALEKLLNTTNAIQKALENID